MFNYEFGLAHITTADTVKQNEKWKKALLWTCYLQILCKLCELLNCYSDSNNSNFWESCAFM